ncbi:Glutathione peroxidase 3 [Halocaridina rubra]|uniref:glutathione peroxidase n=1 Tax=Halocaridina rubra TaxID=373956 RepID=A0AAN9A7N2_HALRR
MQEPGVDGEILDSIRYVRPGGGFYPKITLFEKTEVNGDGENEIYKFLKKGCDYTDSEYESRLFYSPLRVGDIHWNFEKFLIDKRGKPFARYHPEVTDAEDLYADIDDLL